MLPQTTHSSERVVRSRIPEYIKRAFSFSMMDFDFALAQMVQLCFAPQSVFRASKHRKLTKNHWSRDDPAFVVLQVAFLVFATAAYLFCFSVPFPMLPRYIIWEVLVHYLLFGMCIATLMWYLTNRYLLARGLSHSTRQEVEWLHAFDIHCNAFFPLFLLLYVVQYMLLPILLSDAFFPRILSNSLWALACGYYHYINFIGYLELPILNNQEYFLYPIAVVVALLVLSVFFPVNATHILLKLYFPGV
jgi:hypothetical protein